MRINRFIALLLIIFSSATAAEAIILRGIVSEVRDGQTIIVSLQNGQNMIVSLKAVDAPELDQDHGDLSRQHLANLVLKKPVEIDFTATGSAQEVARVICNQIDISLQVLRDGSAWYDRKMDPELTESERNIFGLAEKLAREEQRGIWRDGTPMPPWEWRQMQYAKNSPASLVAPPRKTGNNGLQQDDLLLRKRNSNDIKSTATGASSSATTNTALTKVRSPKPPSTRINSPGQDADFRAHFSPERMNIVYFYADWCPACRGLTPVMAEINKNAPDMQVLFMDIGEWDTPVTQKYNITSVPHLKVYDKSGTLIGEGRAAREWLLSKFAKK